MQWFFLEMVSLGGLYIIDVIAQLGVSTTRTNQMTQQETQQQVVETLPRWRAEYPTRHWPRHGR